MSLTSQPDIKVAPHAVDATTTVSNPPTVSPSPTTKTPQAASRRRKRKPAAQLPSAPTEGEVSADSDDVEPQSRRSPCKAAAPTSAPRRQGRRPPATPTKRSSPPVDVDCSEEASRQPCARQRPSPAKLYAGSAALGPAPARPLSPTLVIQHVPAQHTRPRHSRSRSAATLLTDAHHTDWDMPASQRQGLPSLTWQQQQPSDPAMASKDKRPSRRRAKSLKGAEKPQSTARSNVANPVPVGAIRILARPPIVTHDSEPTPQRPAMYPASVPNQAPLATAMPTADEELVSALTWQQSLFQGSHAHVGMKVTAADLFGPLEDDCRKTARSAPVSPPKRSSKKAANEINGHALESRLAKLAVSRSSPGHDNSSSPVRQSSQLQTSSPPFHSAKTYPSIFSGALSTSSSPLKSQSKLLGGGGAYAGPGFHNSPSAGELPIPKFMHRAQQPIAMEGLGRAPITVFQ